jgi:lactate dehydrogenase-like 2-hydroxyacid dehydrogenase
MKKHDTFIKWFYNKCMYMSETRGGKPQAQGRLSVAIYDTPRVVGERLASALTRAGHDVLFEGNLKPETAMNNADVWVIKWSYGFQNYDFLRSHHPRLGFVSATKGVDHINRQAMSELGLRADNCPAFSTIPVAEHAIALAMRSIYGACRLPPLSTGLVAFSNYSDEYAERVVAQMLMRIREIDRGIGNSRSCTYLDSENRRPSEPWYNHELAGARIGIIGRDRGAFGLARILKEGFDCDIYGYDVPEELLGYYRVKPDSYLNIIEHSEYLFLCTSGFGPQSGPWTFDSTVLPVPEDLSFGASDVAVLGTGAIGSTIARICNNGFGCHVRAYNRSRKPELAGIVEYLDPEIPISGPISDSDFSFISLPLNDGTSNLIASKQMGEIRMGRKRVLVNVGRDRIVDSDAVYDYISRGALLAYATDVVPNDASLCKGQPPDDMTLKFLKHPAVVPTPHEGECSKNALDRLTSEVLAKLNNFLM